MNFHQLTNLQLYAIINSRHLDAMQKAAAEKELERRGLTTEELRQLASEIASREHQSKWATQLSGNILWLVVIVVLFILLKQSSCG